ncbi:MAG: endolytic transglycosylase MltG [Actinomycetota bacterium]|nr:endolytic transglycosylase MltG [Actinomycetota bacterium]
MRHRSGGAHAAQLPVLAGVVLAAAALAGIAWGIVRAVGGSTDDSPPPPPPTASIPTKPVLRIVFPEGFTREEMAKRVAEVNEIAKKKRKVRPKLSRRAYLRATRSGPVPREFANENLPNLEGFLFPATYEFTADTTSRSLVRKQLEAFARNWKQVDLSYARSKNLTAYDVLIIASMVEEEVLAPRERSLVAAVIYNRLHLGMTLGIDATIRYGLGVPPSESLRQSQLHDPTPYNTRIHAGLPPTPISNPGLAAIQAAAHPAKVKYLFFVRKADCKTHFFTARKAEFDARVAGPRC